VLVVLTGVAVTWWIGQCARLWAAVGHARGPAMVATLGAAWLTLASWFVWWQNSGTVHALLGLLIDTSQVRDVLLRGMSVPAADRPVMTALATVVSVLTSLYGPALALPALSALWIVPLLAWTVRPQEEAPVPRLRRALLPGLAGGALAGAAVVGLHAYQHTRLPVPRGAGALFMLTYQTWVLVAVVAGAVVAAFVAAARAGRYRLLVALIGAQTAVVIGFASALTVMSVEGCVEPLRITTGRACRVDFAQSGFAVGFSLVPAVVVAAITAFAAAAVVAALRRAPALPARSPGPLALRRRVVAVLCVAAAAVSATGVVLWSQQRGEMTDDRRKELLSAPVATEVTARTRAAQLYAWNRYGGKELNQRLLNTLKRHSALLSELGSGTGTVDVSPLRPTCAEFGQIARDAERYFRIPDATAQQHWSRYIELGKQSSAHCLDALDHGQERLLVRSSEELTDAVSAANSALSRLEQIKDG
jgi:hypothetical protein